MTTREMTVTEIVPGVFHLRGIGRSAHCYLFKGTRRAILVDTGLPSMFGNLTRAVAECGMDVTELDLTILTL